MEVPGEAFCEEGLDEDILVVEEEHSGSTEMGLRGLQCGRSTDCSIEERSYQVQLNPKLILSSIKWLSYRLGSGPRGAGWPHLSTGTADCKNHPEKIIFFGKSNRGKRFSVF